MIVINGWPNLAKMIKQFRRSLLV